MSVYHYHFCRDKHVFFAANICRDTNFVPTKIFCRKKRNSVATKVLSQETYFSRDKRRVYRDKTFVATKMVLVAAPANDKRAAPSLRELLTVSSSGELIDYPSGCLLD